VRHDTDKHNFLRVGPGLSTDRCRVVVLPFKYEKRRNDNNVIVMLPLRSLSKHILQTTEKFGGKYFKEGLPFTHIPANKRALSQLLS